MPMLTRRRVAGLYLTARLAGVAMLPALLLVLPGRSEVVGALPQVPTGGVMTLVSHAGTVLVWDGSLSAVWLVVGDGVRRMMGDLSPAAK